jgi:signal transduction histidine kinase
MMRLLAFFVLLNVGFVYGQKPPDLARYGTKKERLQAWIEYCDELINKEESSKLRRAGKKGLEMTDQSDYERISLFLFYTGITFNYGVETDSAAYYMERSEKFARKAQNPQRTLEALKQLHYIYAAYGKTKKRERIITAFEEIIDTTRDLKAKAEIYSSIGEYYVNLGQYEKGLSNLLNGIKLRRQVLSKGSANDSTNLGVQLIVVSELYIGLKKYDLALDYLKESIGLVKGYTDASAHIYKDFIECYCAKKEIKKARNAYLNLQQLVADQTEIGSWPLLIESDLILSNYYNDQNTNQKALFFANHAKALAPKYADDFLKAQVDVMLGLIYLKRKEYEKALTFLKAAEPTTAEDDPELNAQLKQALAETHSGLKHWKEAFQYQKEYAKLRDQLATEKSKKNLVEMEALYQNERKQGEITRLSARDAINKLKIEEANQQRMYFLLIIAAVLIIGILLFVQSRNRKRHNAVLQRLNEELKEVNANKTRFFSIINHDLRSPVANLIHFLQLQKESPELMDEITRQRLEHKTMEGAENLLSSMEDMLLWSKGQMQQFRPAVEKLNMSEVFTELQLYFASDSKVELIFDKTNDVFIKTDRNYLLTILRNLTANAIKALEKVEHPRIRWSAAETKDMVMLIIEDNGPGAAKGQFKALYDASEVVGIKTGLGLHLIRDLAKAIDCSVEVTTQETSGTTISLIFNKPGHSSI